MSNLTAEEQEILTLYDEACRLKDIACKSVDNIDVYPEAARRLHRAAKLSAKLAEDEATVPDDKFQHLVFGQYYSYEEHNCMGGYYYEKRDTERSARHHKLGAEHLNRAVTLIESIPTSLSPEIRKRLAGFLSNWRYFQRHVDIEILATEARAAWDAERFIDALDIYRQMAARQKEFIDSTEFKGIAPRYQRIAVANFIGSMTNVSSALAGAVLARAKRTEPDGVRELTFDLLVKLVRYTLEAYRFGNAAFDQNPEWEQYHANAQQCVMNIQNFLKDNPHARIPLAAVFGDDPDFSKILKLSDVETRVSKMGKVKILLMSANPAGTTMLRLDEEMRAITQKIRAAEHRDLIEVVTAGAVRPDDLLQAMNEHRPHVVQFSGHGSRSEAIIVCDEDGSPKPVSKDALVALFESTRSNVQVVVLNSCYSRAQAEAIVSIVPCAVGMKDSVGDRAALVFAASFYRAIAFGHSVKIAFQQGIAALKLEGIAQDDIPELLAQDGVDPAEVVVVVP